MGPVTLAEEFDVWEADGPKKRVGFYFSGLSRPTFLTYEALREEFEVEDVGEGKCRVTRTLAIVPAFLTRYVLGWVVRPMLDQLFTKDCPRRLEEAVKMKVLPLKYKTE
mmetsp:Transcript_24542/g.61303  ORF Transcript_24542/g.61303 Transcript_24542/m.61303 type:complete len:109 (-) Transcript_24542:209-535(-)